MTAYILDCETTDRKPPLEPIEIAWMRFPPEPGLFGDDYESLPELFDLGKFEPFFQRYKPTLPITFGSMAIHHILPHELDNCQPPSEFKLPEDCVYLIGHSIDFDWEAIGRPPVKRIDTHAMATHVWPEATGYSQGALFYMIHGTDDLTRDMLRHAHSALNDIYINMYILQAILILKPDITTWSQLWEFSEECRIPRTCPMKRYEGVELENLEQGFVDWCLNQSWLDPYFRKGLERVMANRYAESGHA